MGTKKKRKNVKKWKRLGQLGKILNKVTRWCSNIIFRTYFKTADKYRSESMSAVPKMKLRMDQENLKSSSQMSNFIIIRLTLK